MTRAQRTALEQLAVDLGSGTVGTHALRMGIEGRVQAILALPEPDHTALIAKLEKQASRFESSILRWDRHECRHYGVLSEHGKNQHAEDCILWSVREAIAALRGEEQP